MVEKQSDYTGAADSVLNFYGVQLQSHAALAVGAFIGFFGVLQLAIANSPPSPKFLIVLPPVMAVLIFLVVYSVLRLIVYGSFANAILRKDMENCPSHREVSEQARTFYFENYRSMWRRILYGGEEYSMVERMQSHGCQEIGGRDGCSGTAVSNRDLSSW